MNAPAQPLTLEQKIELAAQQSESVIAIFSPSIAGLVQAGVEVEPIVSGFLQMIISLFKHHVTATPAPSPAAAAASLSATTAAAAPAPAAASEAAAATEPAPAAAAADDPPKPVIQP